ncbi:MAG: NUDIX hydrolase [Pseudobdellovibrionaceae bacterium]
MLFDDNKVLAGIFQGEVAADERDLSVAGVAVHKFSGIIVKDGGLVLVQREAKDKVYDDSGAVIGKKKVVWWELPGGKSEAADNGDPRNSVKREALEECGVNVNVGDVLWVDRASHRKNKLVAYYPCQYVSGEVSNTLPEEHLDARTFLPDELHALSLSGVHIRVPEGIISRFMQDPSFFEKCVTNPPVLKGAELSPA